MNIKRAPSFAIIALVYALATVVGVLIYQALDFTAWLSLLIADIVATLVVFAFSVIFISIRPILERSAYYNSYLLCNWLWLEFDLCTCSDSNCPLGSALDGKLGIYL